MNDYSIQLSPAAVRAFKRLSPELRERIREALKDLATDAAEPGRIAGKKVKTIRGTHDTFHRLRVGDHRIMYDVIDPHQVVLVLGIVDRADLQRWIRNR